jgi:uncharacterized membrane protein
VGALEQDSGERRVRSNPWLVVAIAAAVVLVVAWIAWAIHVGADKGGREALGVLITWPLIILAVALISLLLFWVFRLARGRRKDSPSSDEAEATTTSE